MASLSRSSQRAEARTADQNTIIAPMRSRPTANFNHAAAGGGGGGGGGEITRGMKRGLDDAHEAERPNKTRIAVEVVARDRSAGAGNSGMKCKAATTGVNAAANDEQTPQEPETATQADSSTDQNLTKHQAKVINGIKHELDRLQPQQGDASAGKEGGRKLRSQESSRYKSELAAYFPEYDEVIGNEEKEECKCKNLCTSNWCLLSLDLFNVDTPIVVSEPNPQMRNANTPTFPVRGYGDALYTDIVDAQRVDFSFLNTPNKNSTQEDPLPDSLFEPVHRRAERLERSIRNTEKGRAQHEKDQIVRLLEGLQGHDWLRIMGVSGITETKKRDFDPSRQYFIRGCQTILDKFHNWGLEEKRRKAEKEKAKHADEDESEEDEEIPDSTRESSESSSPHKQLRQEAMAQQTKVSSKSSKRPRPAANRPPPVYHPPAPPKEFKSFFDKQYERDTAVNRTRRTGRKILAWGLPLPDIPEMDFDLPEEYRDEETLRVRARRKRRDKRGSARN